MARYNGTVISRHSAEEVFAYLADLRSVAEWDPSVESSLLTSGEPGTEGARYQLEVGLLGRILDVPYETASVEPPDRVVFTAETEAVSIRDQARIRAVPDGGCTATWDAELHLKGIRKLFEPLLGLAFKRLGSDAERGLRECLNREQLSSQAQRARA
jgi:hypothetical protein